jgi:hypothetical protein
MPMRKDGNKSVIEVSANRFQKEKPKQQRRCGKSKVRSVQRFRPSHPQSMDPTNQLVPKQSVVLWGISCSPCSRKKLERGVSFNQFPPRRGHGDGSVSTRDARPDSLTTTRNRCQTSPLDTHQQTILTRPSRSIRWLFLPRSNVWP